MKKIAKFIMGAALSLSSVMGVSAQSTPNFDKEQYHFDKEQYQKALWMTGRFYGAQRMGEGVNWLVATHEPNQAGNGISFDASKFVKGKSFLKDADGSYNLTGGWFDCGDFILFGQTFFYSAYMLLLGYSEFPEGYDDYYSFDYSGYINADDYTWEGKKGKPNGVPDILDEAKYATDFILKAVRDNKTFYFQKGDASDHDTWCTSPVKSACPTSKGGESDGSRAIKKASGGETAMSSLAGASLAAMARLYKKFDPEYANQCLEKALVAYDFAMNTAQATTDNPGFYGNKPKYTPDLVTLCVEMYRATGDKKYLTKAEQYCTWMNESKDYDYNYALNYNNTEDLAAYLIASLGSATSYGDKAMNVMDFYANTMYKPASGYLLNTKGGSWGAMRYPCNMAFSHALYWKLKGEKSIDPYTLTTIEFVMGKNSSNRSLIVGFGKNYPVIPHHRNFYRYDGNDMTKVPVPDASYKFIQLGFLVGGGPATAQTGAYTESLSNYEESEGGIDYNAGLVGALGYLNSVINPINVNKFGHPTPNLGESLSICGKKSILLDAQVAAAGNRKFTWFKDGVQVESSNTATTYSATSAGVYTCQIDSAGEWQTEGSVTIKAELPDVEMEEAYELCDPATVTLDATMDANVTYTWSKDGKVLENETEATYLVTKAGEYKCVIASTGCESVTLSTTVTSLLPEVADAESNAAGTITMTVTSDGEYEWYDVAEGGTPLHTGSTFTTTITEDKLFYVQDAGAMSIVVGPTATTFTNKPSGRQKLGARFTADKALLITGITVDVEQVYYNDGQKKSAIAVLSHNGKETSYTSEALAAPGAGKNRFDFSKTPIEINEAGQYELTISLDNRAMALYEGGPAYSTYANNGSPITFTGASDGQNNPFPGFFDWEITTGSGCGRAVVKAVKGNSVSVDDPVAATATVYPNPCKDVLFVHLNNMEGDVKVEIVDLLGSVVMTETTTAENLQNGINIANLAKSIYVVRIYNGIDSFVSRIVKE